MTRQEARAAGLTRYFTGRPCKHGHIAERRMSDGRVVCAHLHATTWQKANPEKVRARSRAYRAKNLEMVKAKSASWSRANRAKHAIMTKAWRAANAERVKAVAAARKKAKAGLVNATNMRRYAAKLHRTPFWADHAKIARAYELAQEYRDKGIDCEVDHIIPLQGENVSGLHVHTNLQIIATHSNRSKSNRFSERI